MRPTFTRRALATVAAVAASAALATPAAGAQSLSFTLGGGVDTERCTSLSPAEAEQVIAGIHEHTNRERVEAGRAPVERLDSLDQIAGDWSEEMARDDDMDHNPEIRQIMAEQFPRSGWGENVLQNWCGADGAELTQQWMNSFGHRLNLLNPAHTHLGVGVAVADSGKLYATQNFVSER